MQIDSLGEIKESNSEHFVSIVSRLRSDMHADVTDKSDVQRHRSDVTTRSISSRSLYRITFALALIFSHFIHNSTAISWL